MIGTLTALQWFIYDGVKVKNIRTNYLEHFFVEKNKLFKVALRLPRPPPPEMPASLKAKLGIAQQ